MTALAMIIGMVPMALGLGEGGEQNAPLGRAVIGGLLVRDGRHAVLRAGGLRRAARPPAARAPPATEPAWPRMSDRRSRARSASTLIRAAAALARCRWSWSPCCSRRAVVAALWGISTRARALTTLTRETADLAVPTVAVTQPDEVGGPAGSDAARQRAAVHRRRDLRAHQRAISSSGYADIGSRVKKGQLLAEIDTPEIDQQLLQARADLATAEANAKLAQTTAERYRDLIKSESVSQQDVDNANGGYDAQARRGQSALRQREAARAAAGVQEDLRAVRRRDHRAQHRHRRADRTRQQRTTELFHIASTTSCAVYVNVPQVYSQRGPHGPRGGRRAQSCPGALQGNARADVAGDRSDAPDAARRDRSGQSRRRAAARRLRGSAI